MTRQAVIRLRQLRHAERHRILAGSRLRDFILGWQDGLVNVLGIVLGVATAAPKLSVILVAAIAAAFAESISMAAVAYTSFKAESDFYLSEVGREKREMKEMPDAEMQEIRDIYSRFGFRGSLLKKVVDHITSNKKRWLEVMMEQELKIYPSRVNPLSIAWVVGLSALMGSFIPISPFFFMPINAAVWTALIISAAVLFFVGYYKAKTTIGSPVKSGAEMVLIGMLSALVGYLIGAGLGQIFS